VVRRLAVKRIILTESCPKDGDVPRSPLVKKWQPDAVGGHDFESENLDSYHRNSPRPLAIVKRHLDRSNAGIHVLREHQAQRVDNVALLALSGYK
jgi:hypothetical protein